jgi:3-oxoacyl-[acyl-carrier-protein] synthase-3
MTGATRSIVTGVGGYLPAEVVTNDQLSQVVATTDAWIAERTGIRSRRRAAEGEATSDLGAAAARQALERAGRTPADIDLIVVATTTPDLTFPATAAIIQRKLGAPVGIAFDVQAVCSGFVFALGVADSFIICGHARRALVIGAETMTRLMDWTDRGTCVLFGDGAGAASRIAASLEWLFAPTAPSRISSMSTAVRRPTARSASFACRATRSFGTPW